MTREELERHCLPSTPEQVLEGLIQLYDWLSCSIWSDEGQEKKELVSLNAALEVVKATIQETGG